MKLHARTVTNHLCGFLERAKGHTGSFTSGAGTFCSMCHERIFNPRYTGTRDDPGDMEIVERLRKEKVAIPLPIQQTIERYQDEVGWKPKWTWDEAS